MFPKQVLRGSDADCQPTVRNLAEVLDKLSRHGCDLEAGRLTIEVPVTSPSPSPIARLLFSATRDDKIDVRFDLPMLQAVKAITTTGTPRRLLLEELCRAEVDSFGNVTLTDGTSVHEVNFVPVEFPRWTDLEKAIIWLTIKAFGIEKNFLRRLFLVRPAENKPVAYGWEGIDYGILHTLREPNVKALTRYINKHIEALPRENGQPPFKPVTIFKVQQTLNIAGVGKVRGHKQRQAA